MSKPSKLTFFDYLVDSLQRGKCSLCICIYFSTVRRQLQQQIGAYVLPIFCVKKECITALRSWVC